MAKIDFRDVVITGGFWKEQQKINQNVTQKAVYERFQETGRFDAIKCDWKEGRENKPHIFWDSDIAKWIEGASYILESTPNPEVEDIIDEIADHMQKNQQNSGYFNSYFLSVEPEQIFVRRMDHELYCAGHFLEAAIAYYEATGKEKLLNVMQTYVDYIYQRFYVDQDAEFDTPGHQEIEMALYRLYLLRNREKDLLLLRFFINKRGNSQKDQRHQVEMQYTQSHLPVREQTEAVGHCVRAIYLYCGMADLARADGDTELWTACQTLYRDMVQKKMYITGGVGSTHLGEAFTYPYDLPDDTAYTETCASIALAMFCRRLWVKAPLGEYADVAERAIYNTVLAGISLSGDHFFYENPLAVNQKRNQYNDGRPKAEKEHIPIAQRVKMFDCSCCPPNLLRLIASIGEYAYSVKNDTVYTHLFMNSAAKIAVGKKQITIEQKTDYPYDHQVQFTVKDQGTFGLAIRIPGWAQGYTLQINDHEVGDESLPKKRDSDGYAVIHRTWEPGDKVQVSFDRKVVIVRANPLAVDMCGRCAVSYGPLVYCAEGVDHLPHPVRDIRIGVDQKWQTEMTVICGRQIRILKTTALTSRPSDSLYEEGEELVSTNIRLIPYYAWANRGLTDMTVWLLLHHSGDSSE